MNAEINQGCVGPAHRIDARVKLLLLAAYFVTLFLIDTWLGLLLCAVACGAAAALSAPRPKHVLGVSVPVFALALILVLLNSFSLAQNPVAGAPAGFEGVLATAAPVRFAGGFSFVPAGFEWGLFCGIRVLLLVFSLLVVGASTASTDLTDAFRSFMNPLRAFRVPVDDMVTALSIAVRFVPLMADELARVRNAQWSRGAKLDEGTLRERLQTWVSLFVPLTAGLFRRADTLAEAMDARCYGLSESRTSLSAKRLTAGSGLALAIGLVALATLACML
ncbi:MAG: energy-coupling factor transporter transmembrane protein EcfT [Eggerthellaceae bacterium]|nr:energy-coupling factor transporter transmembrane protein EcfT [Eggerthellaceae bacterium]